MTTIELGAMQGARPFRPFRIKMADGTHHDVPHPDFLAYAPRGRTCTVYNEEGMPSILDLLLMTELQAIGQPAEASGGR
jgi:hypothetical protein